MADSGLFARVIGKSENKIMMEDINSRVIDWENLSTESRHEAWGSKYITMVMDNVITE